MERGEVGIVLVRDVSRVSRNPLDAERFLSKAMAAGVLIEAQGRIFDTASRDLLELFGFRMQSIIAWYENEMRVRMFRAAKEAKVKQGYAISRPPIGYVKSVRGKWIKDPDPMVRDAIEQTFRLYLQLGSINNVVSHFRQRHLLFPRRVQGELAWAPPTRDQIVTVLTNPNYTPDYYYFTRNTIKQPERDTRPDRRRDRLEWVGCRDHHEGYVSREDWDRIDALFAARRITARPPIGKGPALLQGIIWCAECGKRAHTHYKRREDTRRPPSYESNCVDQCGNTRTCFSLKSALIDDAIAALLLDELPTIDLNTALSMIETYGSEVGRIQRARARFLQQAEDDVIEARRRYHAVDPDNRMVKADLETRFDEALRRRDERKQTLIRESDPIPLTPADASRLVQLTVDLHNLWTAPTTTHQDRKRLLQTVIRQVIVTPAHDYADLEIVWIGGHRDSIRVPRPGLHKARRSMNRRASDHGASSHRQECTRPVPDTTEGVASGGDG